MNIPAETWDLIKMLVAGYYIFVLNRSDRNQREIFRRLRVVELKCASQHGIGDTDENT